MAVRTGLEVTLGLRPENISEAVGAPVAAVVERVEAAGAENFVYGSSHGLPFVMRSSQARAIKSGESLTLRFDMGHAHFFDPVTGAALV